MAANPLDEYPKVRKALYLAQWITTGATGILGIVFTAQGDVPQWYTLTVSCLAFVWTYTGITAQTNTPFGGVPGNPDPEGAVVVRDEGGYTGNPLGMLIWVLVVVVAEPADGWLLRVLLGA